MFSIFSSFAMIGINVFAGDLMIGYVPGIVAMTIAMLVAGVPTTANGCCADSSRHCCRPASAIYPGRVWAVRGHTLATVAFGVGVFGWLAVSQTWMCTDRDWICFVASAVALLTCVLAAASACLFANDYSERMGWAARWPRETSPGQTGGPHESRRRRRRRPSCWCCPVRCLLPTAVVFGVISVLSSCALLWVNLAPTWIWVGYAPGLLAMLIAMFVAGVPATVNGCCTGSRQSCPCCRPAAKMYPGRPWAIRAHKVATAAFGVGAFGWLVVTENWACFEFDWACYIPPALVFATCTLALASASLFMKDHCERTAKDANSPTPSSAPAAGAHVVAHGVELAPVKRASDGGEARQEEPQLQQPQPQQAIQVQPQPKQTILVQPRLEQPQPAQPQLEPEKSQLEQPQPAQPAQAQQPQPPRAQHDQTTQPQLPAVASTHSVEV